MFVTKLTVTKISAKDWQLAADLVYSNPNETYTVPSGFKTDFASIPRPFWSIVGAPGRGKYVKAAVLHDWGYKIGLFANRKEVDKLFLQAMKRCDVNWFRRTIIYRAVRLGGWATWNGYRQ